MANADTLKYDRFIGREFVENERERFTSLNLSTNGSLAFQSIDTAVDSLCEAVKRGERVSLYEIPKPRYLLTRRRTPFLKKSGLDNIGRNEKVRAAKGGTHFRSRARYKIFTPEQMVDLRRRYEENLEMKGFPSPFLDQSAGK